MTDKFLSLLVRLLPKSFCIWSLNRNAAPGPLYQHMLGRVTGMSVEQIRALDDVMDGIMRRENEEAKAK